MTYNNRNGLDSLEGYDLYPIRIDEDDSQVDECENQNFIERYKRDGDPKIGFNFYDSLYSYITEGYFDSDKLKNEIELRIKREYPGKERGERIWNFFFSN